MRAIEDMTREGSAQLLWYEACHRQVFRQVRYLLLTKWSARPEGCSEFVYLVQQKHLGFHVISVFFLSAGSLVQGQAIKTTNYVSFI